MKVRACGCYYSNSCSICDIRTYGDLLREMHFKRLHTGVSRVGSILVSDQAVFPVQTHGYQESSWTDALDSPQTVPWQNDVPSCHEIDSVHIATATRISWVTPTRSRYPGCAAPAVKRTYFWKGRWKENSKIFYTATIIASHSDGGKFGSARRPRTHGMYRLIPRESGFIILSRGKRASSTWAARSLRACKAGWPIYISFFL